MSYPSYQQQQGHASSYYQPAQQQPSPEDYLSGAFPSVDRGTISAILASTRGQVDPAYNALLAISNTGNNSAPPPSQIQPQSHVSSPALPPRPQPLSSPQPSSNYLQPHHSASCSDYPTTSPTSNYLTPTMSAPANHAQPTSPYPPTPGAITPNYPPASPNLHAAQSAPPQSVPSLDTQSLSHDIKNLTLSATDKPRKRTLTHWASCDGCGIESIKGTRHSCLACPFYDLCDDCRNSGIHNHHRFEVVPIVHEVHQYNECDGCGIEGRTLQGTRYMCQKHENEDWCDRCIKEGKACGGPYKQIKQTEVGLQLEIDGCLPMPQAWIPYLGDSVATYDLQENPPAQTWLLWPERLSWYNVPARERKRNPVEAIFHVETKRSKGRMMSDDKDSWVMKNAAGTRLYTYVMENDRRTNAVKDEQFAQYGGRSFRPVWKKGAKTDSLNFQDPKSGVEYRWMSNRSISTLNDERFDFQRNALFERKSGKERIVADWTWWDGEDEPGCCLTIRDPKIDHAMVIASLCILHDHQWKIMYEEYERDPDNVNATQDKARLTKLGAEAYWHLTDDPNAQQTTSNSAQSSSMSRQEKMKIAVSLGKIAGSAFSIANQAGAFGQ